MNDFQIYHKSLEINITGKSIRDLINALDEVKSIIEHGWPSGGGEDDTRFFVFTITNVRGNH